LTKTPLSLAMQIERLVDQARARWEGRISLYIDQEQIPVEAPIQRELVSIVREALTNAITHANATAIIVTLRFPLTAAQLLMIEVRDNGRAGTRIAARPGHLGLRSMQERATSIGGTVSWSRQYGGGTTVHIQAPTRMDSLPEPKLWVDWGNGTTPGVPNGETT
jgi:two-component system nitrate/nitrite sensor histidine kinase NarQ